MPNTGFNFVGVGRKKYSAMKILSGRKRIDEVFQLSLQLIVNILIVYIIFILLIGLGKTLWTVTDLWLPGHFADRLSQIIADILSFLVILELFRNFVEYFKAQRFRLHSMMDPLLIFVVRELIVILYAHEMVGWGKIIGFAALILSLGIVRTLAVVFSPESEKVA